MTESIRILNIVTASMSTAFFRGQLAYMKKHGLQIAVCASPGKRLHETAANENVQAFEISMQREISPLRDLISLWRLYRLMRAYRPTIVNAGTPKAGLLGMLAARMARVPLRVYLLRGLRIETAGGVKRLVLWIAERLASACAHRVVCVSESLRQAYVDQALARADKTLVLGAGSSNGVNAQRFHADKDAMEKARLMRSKFGIPAAAPIIGFVGRLTRDKGIIELAGAYKKVLAEFPQTWLLLVGDLERGDAVPEETADWLRRHSQVVMSPFTADPKPYYAMMDILAFPSHREGCANVPLEAASMEVPVVGFAATG
ncbi:MAG: glycosyltransferase, partial [Planctomycetota bacterium]|nr:glycosyltransferase [Planctomycetota bacterium]